MQQARPGVGGRAGIGLCLGGGRGGAHANPLTNPYGWAYWVTLDPGEGLPGHNRHEQDCLLAERR